VRPATAVHGLVPEPGQYFGPTNSSSRATASRFATEIVFGFENRHSTSSRSSVSPHSPRMSADSLTNRYRGYSYQWSRFPHVRRTRFTPR
jgi:hypothetical protein